MEMNSRFAVETSRCGVLYESIVFVILPYKDSLLSVN